MQEGVQITFLNMDRSEALERRVRERLARLQRHLGDVQACRVVLDSPHKQPHKGSLGIHLSIAVPGKDIVVKREQRLTESDDHSITIIGDAFQAAERQLEDYLQQRRRQVKAKGSGTDYARVVRLYPEQDYGFIETHDRLSLYFTRNTVRDDLFDQLEVGSEVLYITSDQEGPMGPQASQVQLVKGGEHAVR
jgi:ribosome-associated translation inhibitor RaiA/cold shock CspA family protein